MELFEIWKIHKAALQLKKRGAFRQSERPSYNAQPSPISGVAELGEVQFMLFLCCLGGFAAEKGIP